MGYLDRVKELERINHGLVDGDIHVSTDVYAGVSEEPPPSGQPPVHCEISEIRSDQPHHGDGLPPPLDRPPETEMELRRLIDYLATPENFAAWLAWAMETMDPAEVQ